MSTDLFAISTIPTVPATVTITDDAKAHFENLLGEHNKSAIRFSVKSGGCSGYTYDIDFTDEEEPGDEVTDLINGKFIVDAASVMFVLGVEIDWVTDMMGSSFRFINPNATASCGCQTSFSV